MPRALSSSGRHALRLRPARQPHPPASMEAGERWMLNDVAGKPIRAWDSRRFLRRMTYDELRRPTDLYVTDGDRRGAAGRAHGLRRGPGRRQRTTAAGSTSASTTPASSPAGLRLQGQSAARAGATCVRLQGQPTGLARAPSATRRELHEPHDLRRAQSPAHVDHPGRQRLSADLQRGQPARQGRRAASRRRRRRRAFVTTSTTTPRASATRSTTATAPRRRTSTTR